MILDSKMLEVVLPILEQENEKRYKRLKAIFKRLITSKRENKKFFQAPVQYLNDQKALLTDRLLLPTGEEVAVIDNDTLAATVRKARDLYRKGELRVSDVQVGFAYQKLERHLMVKPSIFPDLRPTFYLKQRIEIPKGVLKNLLPDVKVLPNLRPDIRPEIIIHVPIPMSVIIAPPLKRFIEIPRGLNQYCRIEGINQFVVDGKFIGPLVDPEAFKQVIEVSRERLIGLFPDLAR